MTANIVLEEEIPVLRLPTDRNEDEQNFARPSARSTSKNNNLKSSLSSNNNPTTKSNNSRPKLHSVRSSDTVRFPTLERLENTVLLSKSSKITVEPVIFPGESTSTNNMISNGKKLGSQSDAKSIHSVRSCKKKQVKKRYQSTPTEIFAQNLSEAVLDVDDSLDDGYVYNNSNGIHSLYPSLLSPPLLTSLDASVNYKSGNEESYFSDHHHQKFRRPGLRSTVSELPARGVKSFYLDSMVMPPKFGKRSSYYSKSLQQHRYSSSGEEDEENAPLLYYSSSSGSKRRHRLSKQQHVKKRKFIRCQWLTLFALLSCLLFCTLLISLASPLAGVEIISISNVLGTRKQLILDLHVKARNANGWSVQVPHSAFSVFAASHYVPTTLENKPEGNEKSANGKQEYLGTVNYLDDPLLFEPAHVFYLRPKSSNSTSQIQIKNPGETKGDSTGNERWSLLIRYPYELTVRGVLKYQIFPNFFSSKVYSARICKIVQVDPMTGAVGEVPLSDSSVCENSSSL